MHSSVHSSNAPPPSSRRSDAPLTAERAMMDQIRSKLERAQRRLARNAPSSSSSSYIPSSEYNSAMHKAPVKSVLMEDMPATASRHYAPPPASTMRQPPSTRHHGMPPPPPSTARYGVPPSSRRPPSSKYDTSSRHHSSRYAQQQYKSRSKYSQGDTDPLNGGPPPMSTPYLVYSSSKPPMTGSQHSKSKVGEDKHRHRAPSSSYLNTALNGPPSAMRSGIARPPTSRVRFEGHEDELRESIKKMELEKDERKRRKEREARHQRHREQEMKNVNARAKGKGPTSPIAATRGRRSGSIENPPKSAIKLSAYEDIAQAIPTSPVGRTRRSSINNPPPKSDIKISAFEDMVPRRRSSGEKKTPPKQEEPETPEVQPVKSEEPEKSEEPVVDTPEIEDTLEQEVAKLKVAVVETEIDVDQTQGGNQETEAPEVVESPPPSVVPEPEESSRSEEEDAGDTSTYDTDDSYEFDSDSEYLSSSGYSMFEAHVLEVDVEMDAYSDESDEDSPSEDAKRSNQEPEADQEDEGVPTPPATELSTVKEEDEEEQAPVSRLSAKDLAFYALGRTSISSISDAGSPISSVNGKQSPKHAPPPMSYTPASSAFPRSRALGRPPVPATTGRALSSTRRNRAPPPSSTTSVASYVRRSRARAPMDLKNQLPPSIGVLSGLSSGSSTFVLDTKYFYEVTWKSGEFAFSVQRVYTDENEFEFDDRNQEPQLFLRMLLNTERSTCRSFDNVRVGDVLIRVGDAYVSDLGLEGSGTVLTKFFAKMMAQTPIKLTFQRMAPSDWEGGVEL